MRDALHNILGSALFAGTLLALCWLGGLAQ